MAVSAEVVPPPLCVDLDGTLVRSDLQLESLLALLKRNAFCLFLALFWLVRHGKTGLKARLAMLMPLNPAMLPYDHELLSRLKIERAKGRSLWLCTTANEKLAASVAGHLGLFDGVIASDSRVNIAGRGKLDILGHRFGQGGFDYCSNQRRPKGELLRALVRALRPHQWAKNALVLVPLLAAHQIGDPQALASALLAAVAFCLCASSVYVLNDLLDLEADRAHARKSKRPFASGDLPLATGFVLFPALLAAAAVSAAFLPQRFQLVLAAYYVLTVTYSFVLKRMLLIDAVALAGLYTLRVIAGAGAVEVPLSFWLLLFSVFLFLSLAFVKRYAELDSLRRQQRLQALGRGYHVEDLSVLQSLGTAAGYLSVLVLALYINSPDIQALYHRPKAIWMLCVLMLYWISRIWMMAQRGKMHDDPVVYALQDRLSLMLGLIAAITIVIAV
jgi:4-hydroxybenzoate polyprenyltransferase